MEFSLLIFGVFLQSKTLGNDSGVIFSPPSIMRDALDDSELYLNDEDEAEQKQNRQPVPKVSEFVFIMECFIN